MHSLGIRGPEALPGISKSIPDLLERPNLRWLSDREVVFPEGLVELLGARTRTQ